MTLTNYIKTRGLTVRLVSQRLGVSRQTVAQYGNNFFPTEKTLTKIAKAMTELGAPTTVVDLFTAIHN